jgi:hypothetical protein
MAADPTDHWTPVGVVFENHPIEIGGVTRDILFAAGELSNGVWGFYRPWPARSEPRSA